MAAGLLSSTAAALLTSSITSKYRYHMNISTSSHMLASPNRVLR